MWIKVCEWRYCLESHILHFEVLYMRQRFENDRWKFGNVRDVERDTVEIRHLQALHEKVELLEAVHVLKAAIRSIIFRDLFAERRDCFAVGALN